LPYHLRGHAFCVPSTRKVLLSLIK
jgi:hypothetical protein